MTMAKVISDHKINTALWYAQAPINDLAKLKTLLDKSAAEHLHNITVVDSNASNILEQISTQLTTKQLEIDTHLNGLINLYNSKFLDLQRKINAIWSYNGQFDLNNKTAQYNGTLNSNWNAVNSREYNNYLATERDIQNLMVELESLNGQFHNGQIQYTTIPNNPWSQLHEYKQSLNNINNRQIEWMNIVNQSKRFDHTRDMVLEKWTTVDAPLYLFQMGHIPQWNLSYSFQNAQPYSVQVDRWSWTRQTEQCISISVREQDGSTKELQIKASDCTIGQTTGTITIAANPELFDINGLLYKPKQDYEFELSVWVNNNTNIQQNTTPLILHSAKKLLVKRSVSLVNTSNVLTNPAFTAELTKRLSTAYATDIQPVDKKDSVIYKTIQNHLEQHPDYASLSDYQKEELYHSILWTKKVDTVDATGNPVNYDILWGKSLSDAISPSEAINLKSWTPTLSIHATLFADYVEGKDVEPKPSADDMSSEIKYRNWLSRNLNALTKNYLADRLKWYLDDVYVTQAVNDKITSYTTDYQNKQLDSTIHTAQNAKSAADTLRMQRPEWAEKDGLNKWTGRNDSRLRLMAGKSATMSDTVKMEDGTEQSYTTTLNTRTGKGMSATITLPDGKNLTLVAPTPGDLLSKILTSARIDESQWGQRMKLMVAFWTLKALVKLARDAGAPLDKIPINGTRDEYRIELDDSDNISFARYNYVDATHEFTKANPQFDEQNPDHKLLMTHNFITELNGTLNTILDNHYGQFKATMSNSTNIFKRAWRFMTFDRERMSYEADTNIFWMRSLRWWMTKAMNRKEQPVEWFSFPIQSDHKNGTVSYDPKWVITIEIDGKIRKGKNLAKLVNPWTMRNIFWVLQRKQNITDGFEMQIMHGIYSQLSWQLMQNTRVNKYTYFARDPQNGVMYACYAWDDGTPRMGIIEHTDQNDMLMMDRQKWGRHVGIPEQGIRELNEQETNSVLSRPDIMDIMLQNMLKSREEIVRLPVWWYRSIWLTANVASQLAIAGAVWGIDMLAGGWLTSHAGPAAYAAWNYTTGTLLPKAGKVVHTTADAIWNAINTWYGVVRQAWWWLYDGIKAAA